MIEKGQRVKVDFVGKLANGAEFSNSHLVGEPFEFTVGQGVMLAAFEDAVRSLDPGQSTSLCIPHEKAYGPYDESLIERVPLALFPNGQDLPVGGYIVVETSDESLRARVLKVEKGWVYLDRNHELAGEDLYFDITLVEIVGD